MSQVRIELTQGNINWDHMYLSSVIDFFPPSSIGAKSKTDGTGQTLELHCGLDEPVFTDIDGSKKLFRKRSWVKRFFKQYSLVAGDKGIIEHDGGNKYRLYPECK